MLILVDTMGGDKGPITFVDGSIQALNEASGFDLKLIGNSDDINKILTEKGYNSPRLTVVHAEEHITMEDTYKAVRTKKKSSMAIGLNMLKEKQGDVFLSAGNTGALLMGATMILHRIKGVERPALAAIMPTKEGCVCLIDCGANTVCTPLNLLQFGVMGSIYMKEVFGTSNPKVGIINNGTEGHKGTEVVKEAHKLLKNSEVNFIGNLEGRDVPMGVADVAVCDGFVGNVLLKFFEGAGSFLVSSLQGIFMSGILSKIAAMLVMKDLKNFKKQLDYTEHGGAPLLGVNGKVMKTHGSSNSKNVKNSIIKAYSYGKSNVEEQIRVSFANMEVDVGEQVD